MGINRPSLYAAFGNKEALFRAALNRYAEGPGAHVREAIAQPTARGVAESLLFGTVDLLTNPRNPRGCLMVQGALACGDESESIRRELAKRRRAGETVLHKRFKQAKSDRDLPKGANPADLAQFLVTVVHGMSVEAAGGATRSQLRRVARTALQAMSF